MPDEKKPQLPGQGINPVIPPVGVPDPNVLSSIPGRERAGVPTSSTGLELKPQVKAIGVEVNPNPDLDTAPPIVKVERKEIATSAPAMTYQTSVQKETITSPGSDKTYFVSRDELAGKDPTKDSIIGLHELEEKKDEREEERVAA